MRVLSTWVEIVIVTQWVRRTGQGHKYFEDVHPHAEADRSLHLTHRLSRLHSRLLDHRPCQVLLFRRRPGPQHVRLSYNWSRLMVIAPKCLRSSLVINSKQFTFNNKFLRKKTTIIWMCMTKQTLWEKILFNVDFLWKYLEYLLTLFWSFLGCRAQRKLKADEEEKVERWLQILKGFSKLLPVYPHPLLWQKS